MNRAIAVAGLVLLVGCSSGGGEPADPRALAAELEDAGVCSDFETEADKELFVREQGRCGALTLYTFIGDGKTQWLKAAEEFGPGPMAVGGDWVVVADSEDDAEEVADLLGGEVR